MRTNTIAITVLLLLTLVASPLYSNKMWTLQECIDYALNHNLDIRLQLMNEKEGDYSLKQSYGNFLPTVNAEASQGYSFGRSVDPVTNEFSTERIMRQNMGASSSMVLFAGFQNVNYLRYSLLRNTALRYDTERTKNDLVLTIAAAYMQIMFAEDLLETAIQQSEIISQQLERTQALYEGGTLPKGNVLEIEASLAEEELNIINARNNVRLAYLELIQLLDLDPSDEFTIERPEIDIENEQFMINEPGMVFEKALTVQPSIKLANTNISLAEKQISLDKGRLSPSLYLTGSLGTGYSQANMLVINNIPMGRKPYEDQIRDNFSQYIGISLQIPILNRLDVRTRINQSRIDLERSQTQLELTRNNLSKAIYQAHADAIAAYQKHQATVKSLVAFNESFHYTRQRFELGMVSTVEFNESQTRLATAEREAIQAKYDFFFKMKIMEFYMGEGFNL